MENFQVIPDAPESRSDPTPNWQTTMTQILWGLALSTLTLEIPLLQELLSFLGLLLLYLGFRAIRRENKWLFRCYVFTAVRCIALVPMFALNATIFQNQFYTSDLGYLTNLVSMFLVLVTLFSLWRGLLQLRKASGVKASTRAAGGLVVWYVGLALLSVVGVIGLFGFLVLIILYVFCLYRIFRFSQAVTAAGYPLPRLRVWLSEGRFALCFTGCILVGVAGGFLFFHSYSMDWMLLSASPSSQEQEIKEKLRDLGFPDTVLNDLSMEDLQDCQGAQQVVIDEYTRSFEEHTTSEGKVPQLHLTGIGVQLSEEPERWKLIHHFQWEDSPAFYGTESFQLTPAYTNTSYWIPAEDAVHGRLLYDDNGATFVSPYARMEKASYTYDSIFWGQQTNSDWFASFSLPRQGSNHRGYVAYSVFPTYPSETIMISSMVQYTHQTSRFQYPVLTATDHQQKSPSLGAGRPFSTVQTMLQFAPYSLEE